jgi:hypothetical protein
MTREPFPIQPESCLVPTHNRFRLYNDERMVPARPKPTQDNPEQFVRWGEMRSGMLLSKHSKLLAKSKILQEKITAGSNRTNEQDEEKPQQARHESVVTENHILLVSMP